MDTYNPALDGLWKKDTIYAWRDGDTRYFFVSTDGIGRYYFDTLDEARAEFGDLPVTRRLGPMPI